MCDRVANSSDLVLGVHRHPDVVNRDAVASVHHSDLRDVAAELGEQVRHPRERPRPVGQLYAKTQHLPSSVGEASMVRLRVAHVSGALRPGHPLATRTANTLCAASFFLIQADPGFAGAVAGILSALPDVKEVSMT